MKKLIIMTLLLSTLFIFPDEYKLSNTDNKVIIELILDNQTFQVTKTNQIKVKQSNYYTGDSYYSAYKIGWNFYICVTNNNDVFILVWSVDEKRYFVDNSYYFEMSETTDEKNNKKYLFKKQ